MILIVKKYIEDNDLGSVQKKGFAGAGNTSETRWNDLCSAHCVYARLFLLYKKKVEILNIQLKELK